jgi:hypothetical protein
MPDQRVGAALRRVVQARARDLCEYCRCPAQFATQSFTVEHIEPRDERAAHVLMVVIAGWHDVVTVAAPPKSSKSEQLLRSAVIQHRRDHLGSVL